MGFNSNGNNKKMDLSDLPIIGPFFAGFENWTDKWISRMKWILSLACVILCLYLVSFI